jgi:hypothetical protein
VRRAGAVLGAFLALALSHLLAPHTARAQEAETDITEPEHLVLVRQTPAVNPGGAFGLRLRVDDPPPGAQVRMALHDHVTSRSQFARTLTGESLPRRITDRVVTPLADLSRADDGTIGLRIVTADTAAEESDVQPPLDEDDEGVYPVVVELLDADGELVDTLVTHLIRLPVPDEPGSDRQEHPLATVVVVPMHAPPSHVAPDTIDPAVLAPLDLTLDALLAHPGTALTLAPTPEALAGAAAVDPAFGPRLVEAAEDRAVLAAPWVRLDAASWLDAGLGEELERQRDAGAAAIESVLGRAGDADVATIEAGSGPEGVAAAVDGGAATVIVPEQDLAPLGADFILTLTRPFGVLSTDGDVVPALMADAALAAHTSIDDAVLGAHRLLADLSVLALDRPVEARVATVVLDDETAGNPSFLDAFLGGLAQPLPEGAAPLVQASTVDDVLATVEAVGVDADPDPGAPLVRTFVDGLPGPGPIGRLDDDLAAVRFDIASYRTVFGPDDDLADAAETVVLTAASSSLDGPERRALLDAAFAPMRAALDGIHPPERQRVTLTARRGQIQLVLTNDGEGAAEVVLELRGDRLAFPGHEDGRVPVHLEGPTTRIDLEVEARSSGDARLDLRLVTPDGRIELGRTVITVRTTAVSGVGIVLMVAAAVFLVVWWTRTILRERHATRRRHPAHARH